MNRVRSWAAPRPWLLAWAGLALVTAAAVLGDDWGVFAPDTKPELYLNPDRLLERALSSWQPDPHLGQVNYNTGILPVAAVMTVLAATGIEPWLLQRLVMIGLLLLGAAGTARLVTALTDRRGAGPWLAGVVHAWHPWTVVGAATLPVRLPHAVLPWLLLATHRAITLGGWGRAATAGLVYGAMAGINGGVVNLLYVLPLLVLVVWSVATRQASTVEALRRLGMVGVVAVGVSLYWLLPSLAAIGSSAGEVLAVTEDPAAIARLSPPSEVLRGMGMWTSYVVLDGQVENPEQLALLTSPLVVLAGFLLLSAAVAALLATGRRLQLLAGSLIVLGIVGMLGGSTSGGSTQVGRGLLAAFDAIPAAAAFRTTNKLGTALVLGTALALGGGIGTATWRARFGRSRPLAVAATVGVVAIAAGPVLPGQLHPLQIPVPAYWFTAADQLDTATDTRLALLPGNAQTRYLWGYRGVDDLDTALFDDRHVVWRSTIPAGSPPATNALTAFDLGLQLGTHDEATPTTFTRLLGIGDALVRTDVDWVRNFGRPTGDVLDEITAAPGVRTAGTYGPTGSDRDLPPWLVPPSAPALTHVVLPPTSVVQAWEVAAPLLVVGDNMAVDQLVRAGVDVAGRPLLFVADLADEQLAAALAAGGQLVLSDTNHRREWAISSLTDGYSPLLAADADVDPAAQRALVADPVHQTVAAVEGPEVTAERDPYRLLRPRAAGRAEFAFDGNPLTGWEYGRRTRGVGGWVEVRSDQAARVDRVTVLVGTTGKTVTRLTVETDGAATTVPVTDGSAVVDVGERTGRVRVTIDDTFGDPDQPASILEVTIDGADEAWGPVALGARLPRTVEQRLAAAPGLRPALASAPTSVLVSRLQGDPRDPFDDEEVELRRELSLPADLTVSAADVMAVVRPAVTTAAGQCLVVATVTSVGSGAQVPVRARLEEPTDGGAAGHAKGCGAPVELPAGDLLLTAAPDVVVDHLALTAGSVAASPPRPLVRTTDSTRTSATLQFDRPVTAPTLVSSGQAWHPGWRATVDGVDLGPPLVAGGHAAGWVVPAGTTTVAVAFAPQEIVDLGQQGSMLVAGLAALTAGAGRLRRRRAP